MDDEAIVLRAALRRDLHYQLEFLDDLNQAILGHRFGLRGVAESQSRRPRRSSGSILTVFAPWRPRPSASSEGGAASVCGSTPPDTFGPGCDHGAVLKLRRTSWPRELTEAVQVASRHSAGGKEDILAAVQLTDGKWVAGGRAAVYLPTDYGGCRPPGRLGEDRTRRLGLRGVRPARLRDHRLRYSAARTELKVDDPGRFGQLLRERIDASVLIQRHVPLAGKRVSASSAAATRPTRTTRCSGISFWTRDWSPISLVSSTAPRRLSLRSATSSESDLAGDLQSPVRAGESRFCSSPGAC